MAKDDIITVHTPDAEGNITLHRPKKNFMPKGYEYIIVFQETLEHVLTYELNKTELKTFNFILSRVGFENELVMPSLAELCANRTGSYRQHVSKALLRLNDLKIIVREPLPHSKSYRYRINFQLAAKDKTEVIKDNFFKDKKDNEIKPNPNQTALFTED